MRIFHKFGLVLALSLTTLGGSGNAQISEGALAAKLDIINFAILREDYETVYRVALPPARVGIAEFQFMVGMVLENGKGTRQNIAEAMDWYLAAAEQGHVPSQFALGVAHYQHRNDRREAFMWFMVASLSGDDTDKRNGAQKIEYLMRFAGLTDQEMLVEGERAAICWNEKNFRDC